MLLENDYIKMNLSKINKSPIFSEDPIEEFEFGKNIENSPEYKSVNMKDKLVLYEKNLLTLSTIRFESEYRYQKMSNTLQALCTTVSRVWYQLQRYEKDKNIDVDNNNLAEL